MKDYVDSYNSIAATPTAISKVKEYGTMLEDAILVVFKGPRSSPGSYTEGTVLLIRPSQQWVLKHFLQASGTCVFVRSNDLLSMAQPTQVGQSESTVPLPMVTTLYPF
ncbi:hypothetical protein I7I53_07994 [Histoplasma capsulatum var. duboisii H88]|uniref:Uncharacterized protein n=1 Tax=Ajellomyces capsulatus (strain H88) TaxID=544711 RepID=A0A8A1LD93_AJEC8|nr:hypothetical protein I7I53_07994 [Histoplasma capsulatum var. duboisii H88]